MRELWIVLPFIIKQNIKDKQVTDRAKFYYLLVVAADPDTQVPGQFRQQGAAGASREEAIRPPDHHRDAPQERAEHGPRQRLHQRVLAQARPRVAVQVLPHAARARPTLGKRKDRVRQAPAQEVHRALQSPAGPESLLPAQRRVHQSPATAHQQQRSPGTPTSRPLHARAGPAFSSPPPPAARPAQPRRAANRNRASKAARQQESDRLRVERPKKHLLDPRKHRDHCDERPER